MMDKSWARDPHDVYVVLEEAQIHAGRIKVVEIPQGAVVDELPDLPHCPLNKNAVIHHDLESLAIRQLDELLACCGVEVNGFSTNTCLPFLQSRLGQFEMRPNRSNHGDGIDLRRSQELRVVRR